MIIWHSNAVAYYFIPEKPKKFCSWTFLTMHLNKSFIDLPNNTKYHCWLSFAYNIQYIRLGVVFLKIFIFCKKFKNISEFSFGKAFLKFLYIHLSSFNERLIQQKPSSAKINTIGASLYLKFPQLLRNFLLKTPV